MMRLFRIHVTLFAVCLTVYPTRGISNIFKDFSLFDVIVSNNETSAGPVNLTVLQQGMSRICHMCFGTTAESLSNIFVIKNDRCKGSM